MGASTMKADHRDRPLKASFIKKRLLIAIMATLCPVVCYISRQNLSLAIVAMVADANQQVATTSDHPSSPQLSNQSSHTQAQAQAHQLPPTSSSHHQVLERQNSSSSSSRSNHSSGDFSSLLSDGGGRALQQQELAGDRCPEPSMAAGPAGDTTGEQPVESYGPKYDWSLEEQNVIFEAFFWTYVLCQIPAARLAETIGAKWVLATAGAGSCVLSLAAPWAASLSVYALALVRALMGICQTALFPACYVLYSHWLPPVERSQALPILCVGVYVGSMISTTTSGYFIQQPLFGWEYAFYMPSVLCGLWSVVWVFVGASEPRQHKSISLEEIEYIESKMEARRSGAGSPTAPGESRKDISWPKLFKSQHIWAMIVGFFASNWSFSIVLLLLPRYLGKVLYVSPLDNGNINSVIYILYCLASPIVGSVSAMMIETRPCGISRLNVRKLFQGTALFGQAVCFLALPIIGCDTHLVSCMLFLQIVLFSLVNGGEVQLPTELSPDFSGTIYAIGNCVGSSTGFLVPRVHSWLVDDVKSRHQWYQYFYLASLISALGGLIFVIFGRNDMQDFSKDINESQLDICKSSRGKSFTLESQSSQVSKRQQGLDCRSWKQRRDLETAQY